MSKRDFFRQRERKHYVRKRFSNPHVRLPERRPVLIGVVTALALVFCVLLGVYGLKSPRFSYTEVDIQGLETEDPAVPQAAALAYLQEPVWGIFLSQNRFLFSEDELRARVESAVHASVQQVTYDGGRLQITLQEVYPAFLWQTGEQVVVVNEEGVVVREVTPLELQRLSGPQQAPGGVENEQEDPVVTAAYEREQKALEQLQKAVTIRDLSNTPVVVGEAVLGPEEAKHVIEVQSIFEALGSPVHEVTIDPRLGDWAEVTTGGYRVIFSLREDPKKQLGHYVAVLGEDRLAKQVVSYIDVRFGDHVYLK